MRKNILMTILLCFCMAMTVNAKTKIDSLNSKQRGIANNVVASLVTKRSYYELPKGTTGAEKSRIENAINKAYFQYYNGIIINYDKAKGTYAVSIPASKEFFDVNQQLDKMASSVCRGISKRKGTKTVLKEINRKICKKMSPYELVRQSNMLVTLRKWKGNCVSYSLLFKACCEKMGIKCQTVNGLAFKTNYHMWTRVKVGGKWYYVDPSWNDLSRNKEKYFLSKKLWKSHKVIRYNE